MKQIEVDGRSIGRDCPVYIVAEMSGNHNQDFDRAVKIIEEAKGAGVDAVKLQTYTADTITVDSDAESFQVKGGTLWDGYTLYSLYEEAYTPWEWQPKLKEVANDLGLDLFSTPFDFTAVDFLEEMGVPVYKVASPELIDIPLLKKIAATGKPILMSQGMATLAEVDEAVQAIRSVHLDADIIVLKCTAAYPAPIDEINLKTIPYLENTFGIPIGLSDHTPGSDVAVAAAALGACVIEKHFTLSRSDGGPDAAFSMEPNEMKELVQSVRNVEKALGSIHAGASEHEMVGLKSRRSLFVVEDIKAGEALTNDNVRSIRPGNGLLPKHLPEVIGRQARQDLIKGTPLSWHVIE
jgi:pseudaminic acid synthase